MPPTRLRPAKKKYNVWTPSPDLNPEVSGVNEFMLVSPGSNISLPNCDRVCPPRFSFKKGELDQARPRDVGLMKLLDYLI